MSSPECGLEPARGPGASLWSWSQPVVLELACGLAVIHMHGDIGIPRLEC